MLRKTQRYKKALVEYRVNRTKQFFSQSRFLLPCLFVSFWFIDCFYAPNQQKTFLFLRLSFIPPVIILYYVSSKAKSLAHLRLIGVAYAGISSIVINTMIFFENGNSNAYYAGLNLVALCSFLFIPQSKKYFLILFVVIFSPYLGIEIFNVTQGMGYQSLVVNGGFIGGTVIIGILSSLISDSLERKYIESTCLLEDELEQREQIIKKKTKEGLVLERLSSQFSPQVIEALKSGSRKITNTRQRSEICAVFIDVVSSTDRLLKLDHHQFVESIEQFVEISINTLLKYDLTIDKFYGDGVLAFSNDPEKREDFVERACQAALDIGQQIEMQQDLFQKKWRKPFDITVGIAKGFASVGFYGNTSYIKQYSAIGACLAQSQRLSSIAEPGEILVDQNVREILSRSGFNLEERGEHKLKGFGDDIFKIYNVIKRGAEQVNSNFNVTCKKCAKNSVFIDEKEGIYILKCRKCGFVDKDRSALDSLFKTVA